MILPGLAWLERITEERKESELPEPEPEGVTEGPGLPVIPGAGTWHQPSQYSPEISVKLES